MEDHHVCRLRREAVEEGDGAAAVLVGHSHPHAVARCGACAVGHRADVDEAGAAADLVAGEGGAYAGDVDCVAHGAVMDRGVAEVDCAPEADLPREAHAAHPLGIEAHRGHLHALPIFGLAATGHERVDLALRQFSVRHGSLPHFFFPPNIPVMSSRILPSLFLSIMPVILSTTP